MGMRKCASQPCSLKRDSDLATEVFVTSRMLQEFSSKVPKRFHKLLEEFGVCHFMVRHLIFHLNHSVMHRRQYEGCQREHRVMVNASSWR